MSSLGAEVAWVVCTLKCAQDIWPFYIGPFTLSLTGPFLLYKWQALYQCNTHMITHAAVVENQLETIKHVLVTRNINEQTI